MLQTDIAGLCGEHSQCSGHTGFASLRGVCFTSTLLRLPAALWERALHCVRFQFSGSPQKLRLSRACVLCLPGLEQLRPPGAWRAHSPRVQGAFSPPRARPSVRLVSVPGSWSLATTLPPMSTTQNLRKSLVRNWKPVCSLVGDAFSGAEFAPFPSPLPPASLGEWAGPQPASSSLELLGPSFVLRMGWQCVRLALFAS